MILNLQPGDSIQKAIEQAKEGDVICLQPGEWEEKVVISKSLTLVAATIKPEPDVIIRSTEDSKPVILIQSEEPIEVKIIGLKISGARHGCASGFSVDGRAKAVIQNNSISDNGWDGIVMWGSSQAIINKIFNNGGYGVACYQQPCFNTSLKFEGAGQEQRDLHEHESRCLPPGAGVFEDKRRRVLWAKMLTSNRGGMSNPSTHLWRTGPMCPTGKCVYREEQSAVSY